MEQTQQLTDRELDAALGKALGVNPRVDWIVTCDGGKSSRAGGTGAETREGIEGWLRAEQEKGYHLDCKVMSRERWPRYSSSGDGMLQVIEGMAAAGYVFEATHTPGLPSSDRMGFLARFRRIADLKEFEGEEYEPPLAVALAAVRALASLPTGGAHHGE